MKKLFFTPLFINLIILILAALVIGILLFKIPSNPKDTDISRLSQDAFPVTKQITPQRTPIDAKLIQEQIQKDYQEKFGNQICPKTVYEAPDYGDDFTNAYIITRGKEPAIYIKRKTSICIYYVATRQLVESFAGDECAPDFETELRKFNYNVIHGCLYKGERPVFERSIYSQYLGEKLKKDPMAFGDDLNNMLTPWVSEWFRFSHQGKLVIFLIGETDTDVARTGISLVIDQKTGFVEWRSANVPNWFSILAFSPTTHRYALAISQIERGIYLYDFFTFNEKLLFTMPEGETFVICGMGCELIHDSLIWSEDERTISVRFAKEDDKSWSEELIGEPIVIETGIE